MATAISPLPGHLIQLTPKSSKDAGAVPTYQYRKSRKAPWCAILRVAGFPIQSRSFDTKAQAKAWAEPLELRLRAQKRSGRSLPHGLHVGNLVQRYLNEVTPQHRGAETETLRLNRFLREDALAQILAVDVASKDVAKWRDGRLKQVTPGTVNRELNLLHRIFELARKEWGLSLLNPVADVSRPKAPPGRDRRLQPEEEKFLLLGAGTLRNHYLAPLIAFAIATAMRRGEIVALDWQHVQLEDKRIVIPAANAKSGKARTLPLYKTIRDILAGLVSVSAGRQSETRTSSSMFPKSGLVFNTTADGVKKAWQRSIAAALRLYKEQCKENGQTPNPDFLHDIHFHDLRHEGTSRLLERGLSLPEVQSITGHTMASMVQRYAHIRADTLADKLDAMEKPMPPPEEGELRDNGLV